MSELPDNLYELIPKRLPRSAVDDGYIVHGCEPHGMAHCCLTPENVRLIVTVGTRGRLGPRPKQSVECEVHRWWLSEQSDDVEISSDPTKMLLTNGPGGV